MLSPLYSNPGFRPPSNSTEIAVITCIGPDCTPPPLAGHQISISTNSLIHFRIIRLLRRNVPKKHSTHLCLTAQKIAPRLAYTLIHQTTNPPIDSIPIHT